MRLHNKGFSLIEAMLAVTMMAMILAPLLMLEGLVFDGVTRISEQFRRSLFAHNFLYQAVREQPIKAREFNLEQRKDLPPTNLRYKLKKVGDGVFKNQANLYRQEVTMMVNGKEQDSLVTYIFKPAEPKNEK
jgi:hypothetical protein